MKTKRRKEKTREEIISEMNVAGFAGHYIEVFCDGQKRIDCATNRDTRHDAKEIVAALVDSFKAPKIKKPQRDPAR